MSVSKELLEKQYQHHHHKGDRYGYLVCQGERKPLLKKWIGKGKKILDLGCRDGALTEAFASENTIVGADVDRQALLTIKKQLAIDTLWVDLNQEWPFSENSFDVIVACELLEHLHHPQILIENVYRTLKPGGLFIGSVPNSFRVRNRMKFFVGKEFDNDPTHLHRFSHQKLYSYLDNSFQKITIVPLGGKVLPFYSVSPYTPQALGTLFARMLVWKAEK
jgi:2-polyprenyl-3-methyl-5-hydroxy-6-metoxy-1,4-benzoquinol methylase